MISPRRHVFHRGHESVSHVSHESLQCCRVLYDSSLLIFSGSEINVKNEYVIKILHQVSIFATQLLNNVSSGLILFLELTEKQEMHGELIVL